MPGYLLPFQSLSQWVRLHLDLDGRGLGVGFVGKVGLGVPSQIGLDAGR